MSLGKRSMFLLLNGIIAFGLLLYFGLWFISDVVPGKIISPYQPTVMNVQYQVGSQSFQQEFTRNGVSYTQRNVPVRYLLFRPSIARIDSFLGIYAEPLGWWLVFFIASAMLLLTHNTVFTKGTIFHLQRKFPWISMDEYFPEQGSRYERSFKREPPPKKARLIR